jgi:AcrR family transcriptional regulator
MTKPSRPGTAVREKGQRRVEEILDVAVRVLVDDGYGLFTMRRIAEAADIRLSNLQYYFKTKEDLLNALLKRTVQDYEASLEGVAGNRSGSAKARLLRIVEYLLKDQETRNSCQIFWELWAMAGRDPNIGAIMNSYYDAYLDKIADAIRQAAPAMPKRQAQRNAGVIVALIEGASLLRGFGKPRRASLSGYERSILAICEQLAIEPDSEDS